MLVVGKLGATRRGLKTTITVSHKFRKGTASYRYAAEPEDRSRRHRCIVYCVHSLTHLTAPAGTHGGDSDCCRRRTGSFVLWGRSQAAGDPTADQGGTDLSAIRERVVTLHRLRSRGRGAAADRGVTAPLTIRTGSSEASSSLSLDYQKTTVKQPHAWGVYWCGSLPESTQHAAHRITVPQTESPVYLPPPLWPSHYG